MFEKKKKHNKTINLGIIFFKNVKKNIYIKRKMGNVKTVQYKHVHAKGCKMEF